MKPLFGLWLLLCVLVTPAMAGTRHVEAILTRTLNAPKVCDYQGTIMRKTSPAGEDTQRVVQRVFHKRPHSDRVDVLDPRPGAVIIRIEEDVYWREPRADSIAYSHRRGSGERVLDSGLQFSRIDLLMANYDVTVRGRDVLLGREAVVVTVRPKYAGRSTKIAWIDTQTGLVLRAEDRDEADRVITETWFASLALNPALDDRLFATDEWANRPVAEASVIGCGSIQEVQRIAGFQVAAPVYLPSGFTLESLRIGSYVSRPIVHFTYTDGLAQLSVFERVAPATDQAARAWPGGTPQRRGTVNIWKRGLFTILRRHDGIRLYTVVSNIAESESIKLIESLLVVGPSPAVASSRSSYLWWTAGGGALMGMLVAGWWLIRRRGAFG